MSYGMAIVLPMVFHFIFVAKTYNIRNASYFIIDLPTHDPGRSIYLFIISNINKKLVFFTCCFCNHANMCSFYENAFIYCSQSRLSWAKII